MNYNPSVGMSVAILAGLMIVLLGAGAQWRTNRQFKNHYRKTFGRSLPQLGTSERNKTIKRHGLALSGAIIMTVTIVAAGLWFYS